MGSRRLAVFQWMGGCMGFSMPDPQTLTRAERPETAVRSCADGLNGKKAIVYERQPHL